jgi:hypothetical protein
MKADYSRFKFNLDKHYTRVLQQQGRVTLDADWNEHVSIQADLDRNRLIDMLGACGVPYGSAGFLVTLSGDGSDLSIAPGVIYIAGHRIQLDEAVNYSEQPYLPEPPDLTELEGDSRIDLVYMCVRERHVTYLEDEAIREIALGGPDTTTRVQTIWHLRIMEGVELGRCEEDASALLPSGVGGGLLTTEVTPPSTDDDPCVTPVNSGYRGLENRLYRVEVHDSGTLGGGASIKWSRYNGAVAFKVEEINVSNRILTLARLGWDQIVRLSSGAWIELVSEANELAGQPGALVQISGAAGAVNDAQRQVTLEDASDIDTILNSYASQDGVKVRLWDSAPIILEATPTPIELEDGIRIQLSAASSSDVLRTGDYWTFTARTITGTIDLLEDEPPHGPVWHCCKLALIHRNEDTEQQRVEDCRPLFPALTELLQLHYVGGDGQEAMPGETLPAALRVRVSRGEHPVANVPIVFRLVPASDGTTPQGGRVFTGTDAGGDEILVRTDDTGHAMCQWELGDDRTFSHQQVDAFIDAPDDARTHQRVRFSANLSIAEDVSYQPPEDCFNLEGTTTVAEALDRLCNISGGSDDPAFHVVGIFWLVNNTAARHNETVPVSQFARGLRIVCDAQPDPQTIEQASVFIVLELPMRDNLLSGVLLPSILIGNVTVQGETIVWRPAGPSQSFLNSGLPALFANQEEGLALARLFLKGSKIWQTNNPDIYLDGDVTSTPDGTTTHNLNLPSGDGERGGDFEMWFNLEVQGGEPELDIYVVGVLYPENLLGLNTTRIVNDTVQILDAEAIEARLNALDQGYDHPDVVNNANMPNYQPSETAHDPDAAREVLRGIDLPNGVRVIIQEDYTLLGENIVEFWRSTFNPIGLNFNGEMHAADALVDLVLSMPEDDIISVVICDGEVLDTLVRAVAEAGTGVIERQFIARV